MNRAIDASGLKPVVDKVFKFEHLRDAYDCECLLSYHNSERSRLTSGYNHHRSAEGAFDRQSCGRSGLKNHFKIPGCKAFKLLIIKFGGFRESLKLDLLLLRFPNMLKCTQFAIYGRL